MPRPPCTPAASSGNAGAAAASSAGAVTAEGGGVPGAVGVGAVGVGQTSAGGGYVRQRGGPPTCSTSVVWAGADAGVSTAAVTVSSAHALRTKAALRMFSSFSGGHRNSTPSSAGVQLVRPCGLVRFGYRPRLFGVWSEYRKYVPGQRRDSDEVSEETEESGEIARRTQE